MINRLFTEHMNKFLKGLINELLISGNIHLKGLNTIVLNDYNPNYDIKIELNEHFNYVECKLDNLSDKTNNFYFEYWNYTNNRPTGINNSDLNTLYSHTFKDADKWYYIINYRRTFINTLINIRNKFPDKIRMFDKSYYINGKLCGDKAYIVDKDTFLKLYSGKIHLLNLALKW